MSGLFTKGRNTPGKGRQRTGGRPRIWLPRGLADEHNQEAGIRMSDKVVVSPAKKRAGDYEVLVPAVIA